jgi:patatin-like phospholipase/acyl hydrolase
VWVFLALGIAIGAVLSPAFIFVASKIGFSFYERKGLDNALKANFGERNFYDIKQDELLVTSYDYNSKMPKFFSKFMNYDNEGEYDVHLREAVGASSAAPIYFDPLSISNGFGVEERLIDGGIICNNPALYAFLLANQLKGH